MFLNPAIACLIFVSLSYVWMFACFVAIADEKIMFCHLVLRCNYSIRYQYNRMKRVKQTQSVLLCFFFPKIVYHFLTFKTCNDLPWHRRCTFVDSCTSEASSFSSLVLFAVCLIHMQLCIFGVCNPTHWTVRIVADFLDSLQRLVSGTFSHYLICRKSITVMKIRRTEVLESNWRKASYFVAPRRTFNVLCEVSLWHIHY